MKIWINAYVCVMIIFQLKWVSKIVLRQRICNNLGGISYMNFIKGKFLYSVLQINVALPYSTSEFGHIIMMVAIQNI